MFYSQSGKRRLSRIWKDQNLDQEMILASWIGVGPSRTLILEKVSDYLQNFFQVINKSVYLRMNLRMMLLNHAFARNSSPNTTWKDLDIGVKRNPGKQSDLAFQRIAGANQALCHQMVENRSRDREKSERRRIKGLILEGKMEAPMGFKSVLLRVNKLDWRMQHLEKLATILDTDLAFGDLPKIVHFHYHPLSKKIPRNMSNELMEWENSLSIATDSSQRLSSISDEHEGSITNVTNVPGLSMELPFDDTTLTISNKVCPPLPVQIQIQVLVEYKWDDDVDRIWENSDLEEISHLWQLDEDTCRSYSSDIGDAEIFEEARLYDYYGASGEVDYSMDFQDIPSIIREVSAEKNPTVMFDKAQEAILAYRRQLLTAKEQVQKINRLINPYF